MSRIFRLVVLLGLLAGAGCASLEPLFASPTPTAIPVKKPTPTASATATATVPVKPKAPYLRLWLPPQFNPASGSDAANLLGQRLADFEAQNPGLRIEVRIKKSDEENDVVNTLSITSAAAPDSLPDLILLSQPDLETAALKGLLHPIDGLSTALEDPNWYSYAQQLVHIQNTGYGLPFAGDVMVLVYYPELGTILTWDDVLKSEGQFVFAAGNPQALAGLSLYGSAGGEITDPQGRPTLQVGPLMRVLTLVQQGMSKDVFPSSLANVSTEAQTLQIYRTGRANKGIIWILNYHPPSDGSITPLPGLDQTSFAYATGWVWALAGSNPENQQLAAKLAEFLVDDQFLGKWSQATNYLPTRPSDVDKNNRTMSAVLESAHSLPSNEVLAVLGPLMEEALTRVLNGEQPADVAGSVIQKLK